MSNLALLKAYNFLVQKHPEKPIVIFISVNIVLLMTKLIIKLIMSTLVITTIN